MTGARTAPAHEEFEWLRELLELWAKWCSTGGGGGNDAWSQYTYRTAPSTAGDVNGTAYEHLMLDIETTVGWLHEAAPPLYKIIHCYYRRDMGKVASARACGLSRRAFDARLNLAHYHIAARLRSSC